MVGEDAWYDFNFLKFTEVWFVSQDVVYPGECSMCTEKKVYSSAFGWNVLKISMRSISPSVSFKICISLLIFCFDDLSIGVSGVLNVSYYYCVTVSFSFCLLMFVLCIEVLLCWVHRYLQLLCLPLELILWSLCSVLVSCNIFILRSILSDMRKAIRQRPRDQSKRKT